MPPKRKALDTLNPNAVQRVLRTAEHLPPVPLYEALETSAFDHEAHSLQPSEWPSTYLRSLFCAGNLADSVSRMLIQSGIQGMQTFRELRARTCNLQHVHSLRYINQSKRTRRICQGAGCESRTLFLCFKCNISSCSACIHRS